MTKPTLPVALAAFLLVSCSDDPSASVDAKEAPETKVAIAADGDTLVSQSVKAGSALEKDIETGLLPEYMPLPDSLTVEGIGWPGDQNNYAYRTLSDAEALASIQEVFGLRIGATEAKIVHSVSNHVHEYGMRLNPRRAKTILDELLESFPKTKAIPGSIFEDWITKERSKPWGERDDSNSVYDMFNSSLVYDGLTFAKFDYLIFAHPDYMSSDSSKNTFYRIYVVFAAVDLEDGDFYITLSDWGDD